MDIETLNKKLDDLAAVQSHEFKLVMGAFARERHVSVKLASDISSIHARIGHTEQGLGEVLEALHQVQYGVQKVQEDTQMVSSGLEGVRAGLQQRIEIGEELEAGMERYFQSLNASVETIRTAIPNPDPDFDPRAEIRKINERLERLEKPPAV